MRFRILCCLSLVLPLRAALAQTRPLVDHHQHLFSPGIAALVAPKAPPAVALPPAVDTLVRTFERGAGDSALVPQLYAENAWLADSTGAAWIRGRDAITAWWAGSRRTPFRLTPAEWSGSDSAGQLAADVIEERGGIARPVAHLLLALRRSSDARWRVAAEAVTAVGPTIEPIAAKDLVALLDAAGIRRAVVLSLGYSWGNPRRHVENEYEKVKAENDWTSAQVAQYPDRLRGFCSFNPLRPYALEELERCARDPRLRLGLKLHLANSTVDYHNAAHVEQLRRVFRAANAHRMPIVVHMRSNLSLKLPYGRSEARIFLDSLLPAAPDVPVQIAHLAGSGGYDDPPSDEALSVFAEAIAKHDPRTRRLWFDIAANVQLGISPEQAKLVVTRLRQLGLARILWGSDGATGGNLPPRQSWAVFHQLPLTDAEFRTIATNVAPWMR
jgi:uncharacterized protein